MKNRNYKDEVIKAKRKDDEEKLFILHPGEPVTSVHFFKGDIGHTQKKGWGGCTFSPEFFILYMAPPR